MKAKVDENLPSEIARLLTEAGIEADTVPEEGLQGQPDSKILAAAAREDRVLITQDLGIAEDMLDSGSHPGVLVLRLREDSRVRLIEAAVAVAASRRDFDWKGAIVVVTDRKVRVRRGRTGGGDHG